MKTSVETVFCNKIFRIFLVWTSKLWPKGRLDFFAAQWIFYDLKCCMNAWSPTKPNGKKKVPHWSQLTNKHVCRNNNKIEEAEAVWVELDTLFSFLMNSVYNEWESCGCKIINKTKATTEVQQQWKHLHTQPEWLRYPSLSIWNALLVNHTTWWPRATIHTVKKESHKIGQMRLLLATL